jgi:hypothetical protein
LGKLLVYEKGISGDHIKLKENQVIIFRYTFLRMRDFTDLATALTHLVWFGWPETIENMRQKSERTLAARPVQVELRQKRDHVPPCACANPVTGW